MRWHLLLKLVRDADGSQQAELCRLYKSSKGARQRFRKELAEVRLTVTADGVQRGPGYMSYYWPGGTMLLQPLEVEDTDHGGVDALVAYFLRPPVEAQARHTAHGLSDRPRRSPQHPGAAQARSTGS